MKWFRRHPESDHRPTARERAAAARTARAEADLRATEAEIHALAARARRAVRRT
ncbi:hypothetical protein EDD29_6300 [Actinocorallia herbida]|uniref:Uncharacterized protein n=1 Tax=Actinocorallia herbida TaxID=58109 RepID=A0A3N1D595_9ACTN|nr:hypothetical protein [Actinocorallia herbida]ROO88626.1 hypothetical protein EDD29_6300 [Actinocorallia herbida]